MRPIVLTVSLFAAASCNCLVPVYEFDGGSGGGTGGSAGGGAGGGVASSDGGCDAFTQCTGPRPAQSLCGFTQRDAGFSCIDRRCVYDCEPDRTCNTSGPDAGCLTCSGAGTSCQAGPAGCGTSRTAVIDATNGCPGTLMDLTLTPIPGACGWTVTETSTGRVVGTVYRTENFEYLAYLPELGGTCTGFSLATQVERWLLSCPACQLELRL